MASVTSTSSIPATRQPPPLVNGDRLTRAEFERRYAAIPENIKAELIEGIVYMAPAVRRFQHGKPHLILATWLGYYAAKTPGLLEFGDNSTVRLDDENEPQPDLYLMLPPHLGGNAIVDTDDYITGPPALICEISASSAKIDLTSKKAAYLRNGVQEYLVWRTEDAAIDWFSLEAGDYVPIAPQADGALCSKTFTGLCLRPASLLSADLPTLFALLENTTATPEHADFVAKLNPGAPPASGL